MNPSELCKHEFKLVFLQVLLVILITLTKPIFLVPLGIIFLLGFVVVYFLYEDVDDD